MLKKWVAVLLAALLVLMASALAETPIASENEMAEGADNDWYMDVLVDPELTKQFPYYSCPDVNGDGVPVLIVSTTEDAFIGAEDYGNVYLYKDGEPALALAVGGAGGDKFFRNTDSHTLTHYSRLSGEEHIEVYKAKGGALTLVTTVDRYAPNHGPAEKPDADTFFQDEQEISQEEGEALFAQYANDGEVVTYKPMYIADPWVDMTAEELVQTSGVSFGVPKGAEDIVYRWLADEDLAEMQFTLDGDEYCARIQPIALEQGELLNISGMYFVWENEENVTIGRCDGTIAQAQTGSTEWAELCLWYDAAPGLMYCLSVYTPELDGLDLTAVAEMVYVPMQGDA